MCSSDSGAWYSAVAARLLQERLLLTALELHTELVELGKEEPQLREFFSNPANFERPSPSIVRCPSQATLDSLDLTRLSEDSERTDDVAVLEFELRKAKETINSLRANLTRATECDTSSVDRITNDDPIKPHEKRALNFLIYEYLLQQDCKLTSITFSDEVPDQDFECWDDVGLNIPRPAGLVSIYRGEVTDRSSKSTCHKEIQTDNSEVEDTLPSTEKISPSTETVYLNEQEEIAFLKKQILALETDKVNYQKLYDAAIASLNSLMSPTSDVPSSETTLYNREDQSTEIIQSPNLNFTSDDNMEGEMQPLPQTATQNYYSSSVSTNSLTPDQFEMIDNDKNGSSNKDDSNLSSYEPPVMLEDHVTGSPKSLRYASSKGKSSITTLDDTISFNDQQDLDWEKDKCMRLHKSSDVDQLSNDGKSEAWINSDLHADYKEALLKFCDVEYTKENVFLKDIPSMNRPVSLQQFVGVVSSALPKIIPNILLVKRDEVISLLICTIFLHPDQTQRDKLIQLLLTFKKKMEKEDRSLIISGLVLLLQWNTEANCGLDSDLLGYFWEMLNSKSVEKRMLGAEASVALAPYISLDLVNSLLLSMVLSMCDASDNTIRKQGLLGMLIICPTASVSKYSQLESIFFNLAYDSDKNLSNICIEALAPVLARSTLLNGNFHSDLLPHLLDKLDRLFTNPNKNEDIIITLKILNSIVLFVLLYVTNVEIIRATKSDSIDSDDCDKWLSEYLSNKPFHNPKYILKKEFQNPSKLIQAFYNILESDEDMTWNEKDWFINNWLKRIMDSIKNDHSVDENIVYAYMDLFETICKVFGATFTNNILRTLIEDELNTIEQMIIKSDVRNRFNLVLISIYLGILSTTRNNEQDSVISAINRWSICFGMCSISPQFIGIPIVRYSNMKSDLLNAALSAMWQCVVHSSDQVRAFVASLFHYLVKYSTLDEDVLNSSIVPAIVTLVSDSSVAVKCNAIKSLGEIISKPKLSSGAQDKCWVTLEGLVIEEKTSGSLGALSTTCLAKTFFNIIKNENKNCNKVLPNLIMLCYSPILNTDNIAAINGLLVELIPGLQLATHANLSDQFVENNLLPALRNLENMSQHMLSEHKLAIESLIHKMSSSEQHIGAGAHSTGHGHSLPALLANSESVGRRVTQMFQHSKPAMNLQNIFKKK